MTESCIPYRINLSLWPVASLPANMAHALAHVGVDLARLEVNERQLASVCALDGSVVLKLSLDRCCGLADIEGVLATARLVGLSYVAWEVKQDDVTGFGRSYDPSTGERVFTVTADGEPVLTLRDLDAFEHVGTAETLLRHLGETLRSPAPDRIGTIDLSSLTTITIESEDIDDERL